jgi:hypothetical protein
VPLGPGFQHPDRLTAIREISQQPGNLEQEIHLHIVDELQNTGNKDLAHLDISIPPEISSAMSNSSIRIGGREGAAAHIAAGPDAAARIQFAEPWKPNQTRTIDFDYEMQPSAATRGRVAADSDTFYICDPDAFPAWLPPSGVFVKADLQARSTMLEISVPPGFRVIAPGVEQGGEQRPKRRVAQGVTQRSTANGSGTIRRFRVSQTDSIYAVAGRYQERVVPTQSGQVLFWTLGPVDVQSAQSAATRLAATAEFFSNTFGRASAVPSARRHRSSAPLLRVAETSAMLAPADVAEMEQDQNLSGISFPGGVLLRSQAIARGVAGEPVLRLAEYELARTWFGWQVRALPSARALFGSGMPILAVEMAAEARSGNGVRREEIGRILAAYDRLRSRTPSTSAPVNQVDRAAAAKITNGQAAATLQPPDHPADNTESAYKSALFLASLQDLIGAKEFAGAIRRILEALPGQAIGYDELRSALETAGGRNLAETFRVWRSRGDIPAEFRARYAAVR